MFFLCLIEATVTIPLNEYQELKRILKAQSKQIEELQTEVVSLRAEIRLLKSGRKSTTSSTPSS